MKILGQLLLWCGFLSGAFFTVSSMQIDHDKWATINWLAYGLSVSVGIAGVVCIRSAVASSGKEENQLLEFSEITRSIAELNTQIAELTKLFPQKNPPAVVQFIDEKMVPLFNQFADARDSISAKFGLIAFGEVMTFFASAERFTNRCWSASADGYLDEAETCAQKAAEYLKLCYSKLNELENAH